MLIRKHCFDPLLFIAGIPIPEKIFFMYSFLFIYVFFSEICWQKHHTFNRCQQVVEILQWGLWRIVSISMTSHEHHGISSHHQLDYLFNSMSWWRHEMETLSVLLALCARKSLVTGEFPSQRPVMHSFDVFFDLCLNKRLSKQFESWGWWFEMPLCPLWCHCNVQTEKQRKKTLK